MRPILSAVVGAAAVSFFAGPRAWAQTTTTSEPASPLATTTGPPAGAGPGGYTGNGLGSSSFFLPTAAAPVNATTAPTTATSDILTPSGTAPASMLSSIPTPTGTAPASTTNATSLGTAMTPSTFTPPAPTNNGAAASSAVGAAAAPAAPAALPSPLSYPYLLD